MAKYLWIMTPAKLRSAARTASGSRPRASARPAATIAFSRLWAPRKRISDTGMTGVPRQSRRPSRAVTSAAGVDAAGASPAGGAKNTRAASPPAVMPRGRTATASRVWCSKIRSFAAR